MNVLLLAPHPFYQDRGTPIAVDLLLRSLSARGDRVDVLTYHEGMDRAYSGPGEVRIHRIPPPPGCRNIRPGFSIKKLIADAYMHRMAMKMVRAQSYDVVHAVEESAFMAMRIRHRTGIPYIFDMDSSMPDQIADKLPPLKLFLPFFRLFEHRAIRRAMAVTAVCDSLADLANQSGSPRTAILRDIPLNETMASDQPTRGFRTELGLQATCLLYIGNLEPYQGIDLLLKSFAKVCHRTDAHLIIVGGIPGHVQLYRQLAIKLGIADRTHILGPRPLSDMSALMSEADILVSPRVHGSNTPMKIYSYMASSRAILATDLSTHTQILDSTTACLASPEPEAFAAAMLELINDKNHRDELGREAKRVVETRYSLHVFEQTLNELYDWVSTQIRTDRGAGS